MTCHLVLHRSPRRRGLWIVGAGGANVVDRSRARPPHGVHRTSRRNVTRVLSLVLVALSILVTGLPAWAQPAAPTPQIAITGFIDTISSWSKNLSDSLVYRTGEQEWYARNRGRVDVIARLGMARFVMGLELDSTWGTASVGGQDNNLAAGGVGVQHFGATSAFDLNTDTQGSIEMKWLYAELPVPLIPLPTLVRLGAQPFAVTYRQQLAFRALYSVTPSFDVRALVSALWTARSVDTDGTTAFVAGLTGSPMTCATHTANSAANPRGAGCNGDASYVGTELNLGISWRFAPGLVFDLVGAVMFAGAALDSSEVLNGVLTKQDAKNIYAISSRIRFSF
jgi:hypothetical protein